MVDSSVPIGTVIFRLDNTPPSYIGGMLFKEYGYENEELIGFHKNRLKGLVYEADYDAAIQRVDESIASLASGYEQEFRAIGKDGGIVWIMEKARLIQDTDGAPAYLSVYVDITQQKRMEESLRISEEEIKLAMAQMGKMVCRYDVATRTLTVPQTYAQLHELPEAISNMPANRRQYGVVDVESEAAFAEFYDAILRGEPNGCKDARLRCTNGEWCWEHAEFVNIFDVDGAPVKAIISVEDITAQREREAQHEIVRQNEELFQIVVQHSDRFVLKYDIGTKTAYAQEHVARRFGMDPAQRDVPDSVVASGVVAPECVSDYTAFFKSLSAGQPAARAMVKMRTVADGNFGWYQFDGNVIFDDDHRPVYAVVSFEDVTNQYRKELAYRRSRMKLKSLPKESTLYFECDLTASIIEYAQGAMLEAFPDCVGQNTTELVRQCNGRYTYLQDRDLAKEFLARQRLLAAFANGVSEDAIEFRTLYADDTPRWTRMSVEMVTDPFSKNIRAFVLIQDIDEEKTAELGMLKRAQTDQMTGVYNKATTEQLIRQALAQRKGEDCALFIADIDNLKVINDTWGHAQGDKAICAIASTFKNHFRKTDIVGRVGGDEFMAFLMNAGDETQLRGKVQALMCQLTALCVGENNDAPLRGSIGVAIGRTGRDDFDGLYKKADAALYHVKRNGKGDYAFYAPEMEQADYRYEGQDALSLRCTDSSAP